MKKYRASVLMFLLFEGVAVTLWLTKSNLFYLFNFSYIGSCLSVGLALFTAGKRYARQFVQLAVGLYMLVYLGLMSQENMQIEGFWYYLFSGVFEAATIHYAVAKIFRPAAFRPRLVRLCLLDSHGLRLAPVQSAAKAPQRKAGHAALCDVRALVRARLRPVPDEVLEPRAHHVLAVPHRQHSLLCRRHRARVYF